MIGIYKITSPSGKIYIGQSWDIKKRFTEYKNLRKGSIGPLIYKSLSKYGFENHILEIIHYLPDSTTQEKLNKHETFYIQQYKDQGFKMLNVTLGGAGIFGYKHTKETIEKMKINNSGKSNPNYGKGLFGKKNGNYGKGCFAEANGIHGTKRPKKVIDAVAKANSKIVLQFDLSENLIKEWPSCKEAGRSLNIIGSNISASASPINKVKTAGGFIWKYKEEK